MAGENYDIIRKYRSLRTDILYPFDKKKVEDFVESKDEILAKGKKLAELKNQLDNITIRELKQCKQNLLLSIDKTIELTSNDKLGYPLSRNQGMIIPNYVYGKVLGVMESAMNSVSGFGYPQFYFDRDGDFDSTPLISLLKKYRNNLGAKEFASYLDLESFYEEYEKKIKKLWSEENKKHPPSRY